MSHHAHSMDYKDTVLVFLPLSHVGGLNILLMPALLMGAKVFLGDKFDPYEIAEMAFHAERIVLNLDGGWQDQYATVFGGFNFIEFTEKDNVVNPLKITSDIKNELEDSLFLCYTGNNHDSGLIHNDIRKKMKSSDQKKYAEKSKEIIIDKLKSNPNIKVEVFEGERLFIAEKS